MAQMLAHGSSGPPQTQATLSRPQPTLSPESARRKEKLDQDIAALRARQPLDSNSPTRVALNTQLAPTSAMRDAVIACMSEQPADAKGTKQDASTERKQLTASGRLHRRLRSHRRFLQVNTVTKWQDKSRKLQEALLPSAQTSGTLQGGTDRVLVPMTSTGSLKRNPPEVRQQCSWQADDRSTTQPAQLAPCAGDTSPRRPTRRELLTHGLLCNIGADRTERNSALEPLQPQAFERLLAAQQLAEALKAPACQNAALVATSAHAPRAERRAQPPPPPPPPALPHCRHSWPRSADDLRRGSSDSNCGGALLRPRSVYDPLLCRSLHLARYVAERRAAKDAGQGASTSQQRRARRLQPQRDHSDTQSPSPERRRPAPATDLCAWHESAATSAPDAKTFLANPCSAWAMPVKQPCLDALTHNEAKNSSKHVSASTQHAVLTRLANLAPQLGARPRTAPVNDDFALQSYGNHACEEGSDADDDVSCSTSNGNAADDIVLHTEAECDMQDAAAHASGQHAHQCADGMPQAQTCSLEIQPLHSYQAHEASAGQPVDTSAAAKDFLLVDEVCLRASIGFDKLLTPACIEFTRAGVCW